jgi:AcrR family transcriptional regulator
MSKDTNAKQRIIEVAIEEFVNKGFDGTSINTITQKAKTNKAMVNYYFGNKDSLYKSVLNYIMEQFVSKKDDFLMNENLDDLPIDQKIYYELYFHLTCMQVNKYESMRTTFFMREILRQGENLESFSQQLILSKFEDLSKKVELGIEQKIFKHQNYKYLLFNIILNVLFFDYGPILFRNTSYCQEMFEENIVKSNFREFILDLFFKSLSPRLTDDYMPKVDQKIIKKIESYIQESIKNEGTK